MPPAGVTVGCSGQNIAFTVTLSTSTAWILLTHAVRTTKILIWSDLQEESFSFNQVPLETFCLPVNTSCLPTEKVKETTDCNVRKWVLMN